MGITHQQCNLSIILPDFVGIISDLAFINLEIFNFAQYFLMKVNFWDALIPQLCEVAERPTGMAFAELECLILISPSGKRFWVNVVNIFFVIFIEGNVRVIFNPYNLF